MQKKIITTKINTTDMKLAITSQINFKAVLQTSNEEHISQLTAQKTHSCRVGAPLMQSLSLHCCHRVCFWNGGG